MIKNLRLCGILLEFPTKLVMIVIGNMAIKNQRTCTHGLLQPVKFLTFIFTFALYLYTTIPNSQVPTSVKLPFNVILSHIYIYHLENIIIYVNFVIDNKQYVTEAGTSFYHIWFTVFSEINIDCVPRKSW